LEKNQIIQFILYFEMIVIFSHFCLLNFVYFNDNTNVTKYVSYKQIEKTRPLAALVSRVEALGARLHRHLFPLDLLAKEMEAVAMREGAAPGVVGASLVRVAGIEATLAAYDRLLHQPEWSWGAAGGEHHLMRSVASLLADAATTKSKREVRVLAQDVTTSCLNKLYTKTCVEELIGQFRRLQTIFQSACSP
jgi:hypothetical protein